MAPLVVAVAAVATGILLGIYWPVPFAGGPFAFSAGALAFLTLVSSFRERALSAGIILLLLVGAGVLMGTSARGEAEVSCPALMPADTPIRVAGLVESTAGARLRLRLTALGATDGAIPCDDVVPARFDGEIPPPGTTVSGTGRWWTPNRKGLRAVGSLMLDSLMPAPLTPDPLASGPARRADGGARAPGAIEVSRGRPSAVARRLALARGSAARQLEELYGPRAPLAASLLLAQRDGVDPAVRDRFARSGLSHLLAISGLHVGLVAGLLLLLGRLLRLPASRAAIVAGTGTAAYVLFLGAPASASRAALQVILLLAAVGAQRPARSEAVVATAALVLLALRPAALLEPGFQLSFAGVAGILALRRPLLRRLRFLTSRRALGVDAGKWLADGLATGVAATVSTGPVVAWHFGQVAPIGVVANLVAIPLVAALVPVLALSLAVGSLWTGAGAFLAGSGALLLGCLEHVASAAAGLPGAGLAVSPGTTMALTAAGGLAFLSTRRLGQVRPRLRALVGVGVGGAALLLAPVRPTTDHLEIHMIDVGQGDAIAIRTPGNRWILVDAGIAGDRFDAGERRVVPYLSLRGVRRLDGVVLTHPHLDHFGGAAAVVDAFRPQWIGGPGRLAASPEYLELVERAAARGTAWVRLHHGAELVADGVVVEFLHPLADHPTMDEDPNSSSVVMRLSYGEFSALLTGDAPAEVEDALVRRLGHLLEAEVLKVGHHGSRTSTTPALLEATGARAALISAGKGNRYGHPHRSVLSRLDSAGLRVFRTDTDGNVVVLGRSNGEWSVRSDRGSP